MLAALLFRAAIVATAPPVEIDAFEDGADFRPVAPRVIGLASVLGKRRLDYSGTAHRYHCGARGLLGLRRERLSRGGEEVLND